MASNNPMQAPAIEGPGASWIQKTPGVCGGDACIRRTRYTVHGLVQWRRLGLTDVQILEHHPDLTHDDLHAAWSYHRDHAEEIEQAIWEDESCTMDRGPAIPVWWLVYGRRLGLSDERIADSFEPPLDQAELEAAWDHYRQHADEIEHELEQRQLA